MGDAALSQTGEDFVPLIPRPGRRSYWGRWIGACAETERIRACRTAQAIGTPSLRLRRLKSLANSCSGKTEFLVPPGDLDPPPTLLERYLASTFLVIALCLLVLLCLTPFWFLFEAASYGAIRGRRGAWIFLADDPRDFWLNVVLAVFWALMGSLFVAVAARNLPLQGGWDLGSTRLVGRWRTLWAPPKGQNGGS